MGCKNCGKPLKQTEGKRLKEFCNSTCRSNYWQKQQVLKKRANNKPKKATPIIKDLTPANNPNKNFPSRNFLDERRKKKLGI